MPTQVQFRRGNTSQHSTFTGAEGELTVDTEKKTVVVHDGSTVGGTPLATSSSGTFTGNTTASNLSITNTLSVSGTVNTNLIPSANVTYSLGNNTHRWANLYLAGNTIIIGDQTISSNTTGVNISGGFFVGGEQIANSTNITLGANVSLTTSQLNIGNTSVNTVINSSSISAVNLTLSGNLTVSGTQTVLNTQTLTVNDNIIVINEGWVGTPTEDAGLEVARGASNNVSIFWDESEDNWAISFNNGSSFAIATNTDVATAYSNATTYSSNATNISSGTLDAARLATSGVVANTYGNSSQIPVITVDDKGRVTVANTTAVAGVTNVVYTEANTSLVVSTGDGSSFTVNFGTANSTYNGFIKVVDSVSNTNNLVAAAANSVKVAYDAALNAYSNATTYSSNADNISSGTLNASRLATSGVTANTYGNSSQIPVITVDDKGRVTAANTVAVAGVSNVVYTESNTSLVISTGDGSSFTVNFGTANSSYNGLIKVVDSVSNTNNLVAAAANSVKVTYDAALNAYSNATTFASNADNISSGTLNTARLPATANITTAINVGANVNLTTSSISIGNSTVNTSIVATGIDTDGTLVVSNGVTFANGLAMSNTIISNVADPVSAKDAANKAYVDAVTEGLHIHPSCIAATPNTLAVICGSTVTYDNGTSGVGATLTLGAAVTDIDGVSLSANNRILVKNEANTAHNGIYNYSNSTVLTRATDFDSAAEMDGGDFTFVTDGTIYNSTGWVQTETVTTVGTSAVLFTQFSGAGVFTAGEYLYLDGSEFNVNATSTSTASVVVARDASQNFSANVVTVNSIAAGNGQFTGPVSGITTLAAGNTTITGFANVSSAVYVGNSTSNVALSGGTVSVSGYQQSFVTHTSSNTDLQTCDSFASASFRSAQYFVQMTSGTDYHSINISLIHNGTDVFISQYGEIIENTSLGTFTSDISGGNVVLQVTPANAVTVIKAVRTLIAV